MSKTKPTQAVTKTAAGAAIEAALTREPMVFERKPENFKPTGVNEDIVDTQVDRGKRWLRGMAEEEALAEANRRLGEANKPAPPEESPTGRKRGKRSDPDYKRTMVLLRKDTEKFASRKWEDEHPEHDFSDLVQALLELYLRGSLVYNHERLICK